MPDRRELYGELEADLRRRRIEDAERLLEQRPSAEGVPPMEVELTCEHPAVFEGIGPWWVWVVLMMILQLGVAAVAWLTP